jgi:hypothetical protein
VNTAFSLPFTVAKPNLKAIFLVFVWLVLSLAAAFRWFGEGRDYLGYLEFYETFFSDDPFSEMRMEIGYVLAAWLFRHVLELDYAWFALSLVATALGLKFLLIWRITSAPLYATVAYAMLFYPVHEYTQIRLAVALGFAYLGLHEAFRRRIWLALLLLAAGLSFHYSVALLIGCALIYAFLRNPVRGLLPLLICLAVAWIATAGLAFIDLLQAVNPFAEAYLANLEDAPAPTLLSVSNLLYLAALLVAPFVLPWRSGEFALHYLLTAAALVAFVLLLDIPVFAHRIKELLAVSAVFWVFRFEPAGYRAVPALILMVNAAWALYRFTVDGIVGV